MAESSRDRKIERGKKEKKKEKRRKDGGKRRKERERKSLFNILVTAPKIDNVFFIICCKRLKNNIVPRVRGREG